MKRRLAIGIVVLGLLGGGAYFGLGLGGQTADASGAAAGPTPVPTVKAGNLVSAEGKVVPIRSATLSFATGGIVAEVLVAEGDQVEAGAVLARLDSAKQRVAVAQAEAGLERAEAALEQVKAGAREPEIAAAKAAVDSAEASLATLKAGARPEEIAAAEAAVVAARASLAKAQEGADRDLIVAAEGELAKLKAGATAEELRAAELAIEQAKSALWSAQTERDGICGNGMMPKYQCDAANSRVSGAENALKAAENGLAKLKAGAKAEDIATAEARLEQLRKGPSASQVENARAQLEAAEAKLKTLQAGPREAEIAAAEAEVRRAKAQLSLVEAGARPEEVAAAEAEVAAAKAGLEQAKVALEETVLKAPFAGVVAELRLKAGESVAPSAPAAVLADASSWVVETTDLTELSVVKVEPGMPAVVKLDALPELELKGKVAGVKALGENRNGDITYKVTVQPEQQDPRLRWNMTASVNLEP